MSTKLADLAVGDTITVKHTVKVEKIGTGSVQVRSEDGSLYGYDDETARFKLVEKALPKVGDEIEGVDAYQALPVGAVLGPSYAGSHLVRVKGGFIFADCPDFLITRPNALFDPRTVVYLP